MGNPYMNHPRDGNLGMFGKPRKFLLLPPKAPSQTSTTR